MSIGDSINTIFLFVGIVITVGLLLRIILNKYGNEKEVEAKVINKQYYQSRLARKAENFRDEDCYVVTFLAGDKKLSFYVSEYSYNRYTINQKGTLKFKGTMLIDFITNLEVWVYEKDNKHFIDYYNGI